MSGRSRRSRPGDRRNSRDDRADRGDVPGVYRLPEVPRCQHEQQHEPECERRLHDGQRRVAKREQLQRPAERRQRDPADPEPLSRECAEETGPKLQLPRGAT